MAIRTFLAVELADETRRALAELARRADVPSVKTRWSDPENLHVTVKFLGDVPEVDVLDVCDAAAEAAGQVEPFEFAVRGAVCVPPAGRKLRMVWANVVDGGAMTDLAEAVEAEMGELGFPPERRKFKAHITVARIRFARDPEPLRQAVARFAEADFGSQRAEQLVVFQSDLTKAGPVYTPMARCPLGG